MKGDEKEKVGAGEEGRREMEKGERIGERKWKREDEGGKERWEKKGKIAE